MLTTIRVFVAPDSCVLTYMDCLGSVVLTVNQYFFFLSVEIYSAVLPGDMHLWYFRVVGTCCQQKGI